MLSWHRELSNANVPYLCMHFLFNLRHNLPSIQNHLTAIHILYVIIESLSNATSRTFLLLLNFVFLEATWKRDSGKLETIRNQNLFFKFILKWIQTLMIRKIILKSALHSILFWTSYFYYCISLHCLCYGCFICNLQNKHFSMLFQGFI